MQITVVSIIDQSADYSLDQSIVRSVKCQKKVNNAHYNFPEHNVVYLNCLFYETEVRNIKTLSFISFMMQNNHILTFEKLESANI